MMGNNKSANIIEESDDDSSTDSDFDDYSLEPRSGDRKELDLITDAAIKTCNFPVAEEVLNLDEVLRIEKKLDTYEIVSLVYLLYDDAQYALQELCLLLRGAQKNLLYNWANVEKNHGVKWEKKIIEALCIIKNYQILKSLGYQKQDLITRYLPHRANIITSINSTKKAIYLVCEKLNNEKAKIFLQQVKLQFQEKNLPFEEYDPEFLELYFLKWETLKYMSATDLTNIKRILKNTNEIVLYDYLNGAIPEETMQNEDNLTQPSLQIAKNKKKTLKIRKPSTSVDTHLHPSNFVRGDFDYCQFPLQSIEDDPANSAICNDNHIYNIDPKNPGILLIINQEHFYREIDEKFKDLLPRDINDILESRQGTEKDEEDLSTVFKKFGYKVIVYNNLTHEYMVSRIKEVVKSIKEESSLFICIMSHGDRGIVYGANSCKVKVSTIQEILCKTNKDHLNEKPKVLILQSCQGRTCQNINESSEEDIDENYSITTDGASCSSKQPRRVDMLTFWATVPGYAAIRHKTTGSWFIQALCKKMEEIGNKHHFADICTRIVNDVSNKVWRVNENENAMTPMVVTTLRKDFYLPPMSNF